MPTLKTSLQFTAKQFEEMTGYAPTDDDLKRLNCVKAGQQGHLFCGFCARHIQPRFLCMCPAERVAAAQ